MTHVRNPLIMGDKGAELEARTLKHFLEGDRIKAIPAKVSRRRILAHWLSQRFDFGRAYSESEVNEVLRRHHEDFATFRREMIDYGDMKRKDSIYVRVVAEERTPLEP